MQPIPDSSPHFSNVQLELLKLFSHDTSDADLLEIKTLIANFYAERAIAAANEAWDDNGWTPQDVERILNTKMRAGRGQTPFSNYLTNAKTNLCP